MQLTGTYALVTGAAHRVGKAIALALAQRGAHIAVHYGQSEEAAHQAVQEITALGVQAFAFQADLRTPPAIDALFDAVQQRFGRLDVLVNSAANFLREPWDAITLASWDEALNTNLRAPFLAIQHAARLMNAALRPDGTSAAIVNITDLSGLYPWRSRVQHGVSKAGLIHLTRLAARELAPAIRVNAVAPGPILPEPGRDPQGESWRRTVEVTPLRRAGDPAEVGQAVVFLAENDYITGAVIPVDGGEHLLGPANH